jgi:hypothetical protein
MGLPIKIADVAPRLATGAYILHSGLDKAKADEAHAKGYHAMASGTYPFLAKIEPATFTKLLAGGEIVLGATLLAPVVSTALAGAALAAFSAGLLGLYAKTPGMRKEGSIWPSQQGIGVSKDVWMLGIGLGFVTDAVANRRGRKRG